MTIAYCPTCREPTLTRGTPLCRFCRTDTTPDPAETDTVWHVGMTITAVEANRFLARTLETR